MLSSGSPRERGLVTTRMESRLVRDSGQLSRAQVLLMATALIDEAGLAALTMRGLARRLGVQAMALYHYVEGREDLLEGVVSGLVGRLRSDEWRGREESAGDWPTQVRELAFGVRGLAREHPNAVPLMMRSYGGEPWPPPLGRELTTDLLLTLASAGFTRSRAITAHRAFSRFLLGHLALQSAATSVDHATTTRGAPDVQEVDEREFGCELTSLIGRLAELRRP